MTSACLSPVVSQIGDILSIIRAKLQSGADIKILASKIVDALS